MVKKKKLKEIKLPMKFNPGLDKFEPELQLRKGKINKNVSIKRNYWAFWYIIISATILGAELIYFLIKYFTK